MLTGKRQTPHRLCDDDVDLAGGVLLCDVVGEDTRLLSARESLAIDVLRIELDGAGCRRVQCVDERRVEPRSRRAAGVRLLKQQYASCDRRRLCRGAIGEGDDDEAAKTGDEAGASKNLHDFII